MQKKSGWDVYQKIMTKNVLLFYQIWTYVKKNLHEYKKIGWDVYIVDWDIIKIRGQKKKIK